SDPSSFLCAVAATTVSSEARTGRAMRLSAWSSSVMSGSLSHWARRSSTDRDATPRLTGSPIPPASMWAVVREGTRTSSSPPPWSRTTGFEASCGLLRSTTAESPPRMGSPSSALQIVRPVVRSMAASLPPEWSVVATSPMSPISCTPDRSSAPLSAPVSIASSAYSSGSSDLFVHAATATRTEHSATAPTVRRGRFVVMGNNLVVPEVFLHPSTILTGMPATQHRGSAGSFLRRGQLLAEGSSRSTDVACRGDEPETLVLAQLGLGPIAAVDAGDHPGGVGGGADPHERLGVGVVQLPRQGTDGEGEVGG